MQNFSELLKEKKIAQTLGEIIWTITIYYFKILLKRSSFYLISKINFIARQYSSMTKNSQREANWMFINNESQVENKFPPFVLTDFIFSLKIHVTLFVSRQSNC